MSNHLWTQCKGSSMFYVLDWKVTIIRVYRRSIVFTALWLIAFGASFLYSYKITFTTILYYGPAQSKMFSRNFAIVANLHHAIHCKY